MSIASEISRISGNVADAYTAANAKGATMPVSQNSDNLATTIATIQTGTTPTGTVNITSNGTHNVSSYEYAEVLVPTTAPAYYIEKSKDANGVAQQGSYLMDFSTFTDVGIYVFANAYYGNTAISGTVDFSGLTTITGNYACQNMFRNCVGITSVDLSNLTSVNGQYGCNSMFQGCTGITGTVDLSSLEISGSYACQYMFYNCTGITGTVDLSSLTTAMAYGCAGMFFGCTGITGFDLSNLNDIRGNGCDNMFYGCSGLTGKAWLPKLSYCGTSSTCSFMFKDCTGITSAGLEKLSVLNGSCANNMFQGCINLERVDLDSLIYVNGNNTLLSAFEDCARLSTISLSKIAKLGGSSSLQKTFRNCTSLTSLSFDNLAYTTTNFNSSFTYMLQGCSNVTVHFPAEWQTAMASWSNVTSGFGGTNTTVLFDLPNVTTLDLSSITELSFSLTNFGFNYFSNITGVDLSNLVSITQSYAFSSGFKGTTSLTNVKLDSLRDVAASGLQSFVEGCTSISTMRFPALKTVFDKYVFSGMLRNVTGCTVHFPSNMSSYHFEEVLNGTSTTVLYDLPATNILTGADTKEYERNPKYDTATALAWRINGTMPTTTTYYTSGLTDPTVGTTIYSDSACTIAETTVDSIA